MNFKKVVFLIILAGFFIKSYSLQAQDEMQKMSSKEIGILIDSLSNALTRIYIYPEKAKLIVNCVKNNYTKGAYNKAKNRSALAFQLYNDIQQTHKDRHFAVMYNPMMSKRLETVVSDAQRENEFQEGLKSAREDNFAFKKVEILPGNIGYIRLDGFYDFLDEAKATLNATFQFVSNCKALIIDIRYNGGGSPNMVLEVQNYFFKERTHMNDIIFRHTDTLKKWADPAVTSFKLDMPVYILTSRMTFSGAEDFAYGLQRTKRATVIGDTTGGGAHPVASFSLGQGFIARIPLGCAPVGEDWEGIGILPNIAVPSEQALIKAKFTALSEVNINVTDGIEKLKLHWLLNNLKADENKVPVDVMMLEKYVGDYDGLNFYLKDGILYCKNENGNIVSKVKPIREDLFVLDEYVQVKFEKNDTGSVTHLQMFFSNGWVSEKWREPYRPAEQKIVNVADDILQKYIGIYMSVKNNFVNIIKKKDGYYLYANGVYYKMYFTSERDFFHKENDQKKHFNTDASGNVISYNRSISGQLLSRHIKISNPDTLTGNAIFFNQLGWNFIENKNYNEGIKYLKRGLQLYPNDFAMEVNLAHCYLFKNKYDDAMDIYKKNLSKMITPNYSWESLLQSGFDFFKANTFPTQEIDKAIDELSLKELVEKEKKEKNKKIQHWQLNLKRAETAKMSNPSILNSYIGAYQGGLTFFIKEGHFFCRNAERGNELFELKYIDDNLFILDENVQIEFIQNNSGVHSKIKVYWKNGDMGEKSKI